MRTLGFRTHLLLTIAAAVGIVATLGRPWYAPAPVLGDDPAAIGDISGPLNAFFAALKRSFSDSAGATGWESLDNAAIALAAMAAVSALGALACLVPRLQRLGRDLLRYGALAAFAIAAWKLVDTPGPNAALELRHGALAAAGCAAMMLTCGLGVVNAPLRRKLPPRTYTAPPPPPAFSSSVPPGA